MRHQFIKSVGIAILTLSCLVLFLSGCAAGDVPPGSEPIADPPPVDAPQSGPNTFNVVIYTPYDVLYIDDLESEFNQRRGIRAMIGFDETDFDNLVEIPWSELTRVDFDGIVEDALWEQIFSGRENQGLSQNRIQKVLLHYKSGSTRYFYAILTKFRGYKDGVKWDVNMTGNPRSYDYLEFRP